MRGGDPIFGRIYWSVRLWWALYPLAPYPWRIFMQISEAKFREELQSFFDTEHEATIAEAAAAVAGTELNNVIEAEEAAVAVRQSQADQAIAIAQAAYDTAQQAAANARDLANRQKYHLGGLFGFVPGTEDPTP